MNFIRDLTSLAPNRMREKINELIAAMRKLNLTAGNGIKLDEHPNGTVISSKTTAAGVGGAPSGYNGMWKVELADGYFRVPADVGGNIILTEDRLFATVTDELTSIGVDSAECNWCYLHILTGWGRLNLSLERRIAPIDLISNSYLDDYIPLAIYSQETGLIQLQYGPVRLNRYWLKEDEQSGGGGGGEEPL